MEKYENLFSQDPIGAFKKIEEDYARYFEIAYKLGNKSLNDERMRVLKADNNMCKEPYFEVLPEYAQAVNIDSMDSLTDHFSEAFGGLDASKTFFESLIANGLMRGVMDKYIPYGHQIGMMEKAFAGIGDSGEKLKYKNTVITSGTGSGKTESFLLPLLANIFKEAKTEDWAPAVDHTDWYNATKYAPIQREGDRRCAAVRAILLYPMNALVEDQIARLREALDSDEVRSFMNKEFKNNRIYFGSYNGSTIGPKSYDLILQQSAKEINKQQATVAKHLQKLHASFTEVKEYVKTHPDKNDALYISPRLGGEDFTSEMVTRWDMQKWAPDIMITNTSMLSIMLMRSAEKAIFEQTKSWLAAEDLPENKRAEAKKNRVFHIIVDELHLYRGTAGSEVACLLRMLYKALGLDPVLEDAHGNKYPNPQIKVLASSASLGDENDTQKFLEEFFGLYSTIEGEKVFNIQRGTNYTGIDSGLSIDYTRFKEFTHKDFIAITGTELAIRAERERQCNDFVRKVFGCKDLLEFCDKFQHQIFADFYNVLTKNVDDSVRPISQEDLVGKLFNNDIEALRGFLIFRGFIDTVIKGHKLPRFRFHKFFKYIEGLWGELSPAITTSQTVISNLDYTPTEVGPNKRKVLELLRCENCGELFIGGNRKIDQTDNSISFTLNYPNLDQIPSFNPTPMVQNKSYKDYAIFWPKVRDSRVELVSGHVYKGATDHVVAISNGNNTYELGQAQWIEGYLDAVTGKFTPADKSLAPGAGSLKPNILNNGIKGFLYQIIDNKNGIEIDDKRATQVYATPCTCPHCMQDYTQRKYTNSPIRSFRTGIDRSNQILSKELLYQLDGESAKLIGFSDSREDAAKQALGIEKEHYRDMVRMLFVECINEFGISEIYKYISDELAKGTKKKIIRENVKVQWMRPDIAQVIEDIFDAIDEDDDGELKKYSSDNIPLNTLIGNGFNGSLVSKLLKLGINPAGEAYKYQWYQRANDPNTYHWSTAYDFTTFALKNNVNFRDTTYQDKIKTQLTNALFANSFGKYMGVSVLDAGIGYIAGPRNEDILKSNEYNDIKNLLPAHISVYDFIDAIIRVMGDNYLYPSNEDISSSASCYTDLKAAVKKPIKEFCKRNPINETALGNSIVNYLKKYCTNNILSLELDKLVFKKMGKDEYLKCPKCGRVHPNWGFGFCTNTCCLEPLKLSETVKTDELHKHYISFDIIKEKKAARKLHTEELSGQTDDIQSRLREFKDLIIAGDDEDKVGLEHTKPIDMICVTTTMEVGVDIGSLQAIYQGNMPPTRYNYQQRVGRGGRRGQAYSTAFTFCRGRSHDVYYYTKATEEMVGGIPATPKLSLAPYTEADGTKRMKTAIMKRVIVKELLHLAYINLTYKYDLNDTAGEFGTVGEWESLTKDILKNWLINHSSDIEDIVGRYFNQFNLYGEVSNDVNNIKAWITDKLIDQISEIVLRTSDKNKGLAKHLAESGLLPMYGMPSDSRDFYHGYDFEKKKVRSIDRSSEMAISEFAPGSEKTKDKGKYRVEGITVPIREDRNGYLEFFDDDVDALCDRYIITYEKEIGEDGNNITDVSEADLNIPASDIQLTKHQRLVIIPQAYRSLKIRGNTGTPEENNDRSSSFSQSILFAKDDCSKTTRKKTVGNVEISSFELGLASDPTIWHINSNNGNFYTGSYNVKGIMAPEGEKANFMFYESVKTRTQECIGKVEESNNTLNIALGSKKVTEMIKLELRSYPNVLNLSVDSGNRAAIRAAFYSAAFLLQRALADKLDVQPEEIEICEKIDNSHEYPSIYLSDALPNGAGIVSYLYQDGKLEELINCIINFDSFDLSKTSKENSFMQSIINHKHRHNCLTACQKCLLTYNNRGFHHVLDWRLGVGILRLMLDPTYDFGFTPSDRKRYGELEDWGTILKASAEKCHLISSYPEQFYWIDNNTCTLIYHPLWKMESAKGLVTQSYTSLRMYNTFKLLRSDLSEDTGHGGGSTVSGGSILSRLKKSSKTSPPTPLTPVAPSSSSSIPKPIVDDDDDDIDDDLEL